MIKFYGTIEKGESSASGQGMSWNGFGSIHHQVEFLKEEYSFFSDKFINCQMATINVKLKNKIIINKWEYTFDKVFWLPSSDTWYEKLSFTQIVFTYKNNQVKAWLYKAYKSPHKNDNYLLEVIAPYIKDLKTNENCEIEINEKYM